jgi:VWFA-related protein
MRRKRVSGLSSALIALVASGVLSATPAPPTQRSVHVTVVDNQGTPVTDLTAADFTLKEGGRDREIATVEIAKAPLQVALAVEETLTPLGPVRQGMVDFMQRIAPSGQVELVVVGQSSRVAVPPTSDLQAMVAGIKALPFVQRPSNANHIPEAVAGLAQGFIKSKPERPVIVMIALYTEQPSSMDPDHVLNLLRDSNALFHSITIEFGGVSTAAGQVEDNAGRAQVLGDGPKQAGGRRWPVTVATVIPRILQQIAGEIGSQYKITYTLPEGQKPSDRLQVTTKRRGVTLRSPSRIPDKS